MVWRALLGLVGGYVAGALAGAALVAATSGNRHDKALEIVMTGIFATGPIVAVVGLVAGLIWGWRARRG